MRRIFIIVSTLLILPALSAFPVESSPSQADQLVSEGETLLELGETDSAAELFRQALAEDPGNREAAAHLDRINTDSAASEETPSELESEPEPFEGHEDMPVPVPFDEQVAGESQEEEVASAEDIPKRPRLRIHYFYRKGLDNYGAKNYREAIKNFEEVLKINSDYRRADYYRQQAWQKLSQEDWAREQKEQEMVEQISAQEGYDAYARGREYMKYGKYEEAIKEFQQVLNENPDHQGAAELMEEARLELEKAAFEEEVAIAEGIARQEAALRAEAEDEAEMDVRKDYYRGRRLYEQEEYESARKKFSRVRDKGGRYRRADYFIRKIDKELWEKKEAERTDFEADAIAKYTLGPEDRVRVVVRNHPEFDFQAEVQESGELIIPLTNEIIIAEGLTRDELAEEIRQYLTAYIDNPFVNVFITGYNSKKFYVLQPTGGGSEFVMDKASMTLWECMFMAGIPMLDQAAMRRIQIITPHRTHPTHRWINVYAMLYEGKMEDNIRIEPGTIIYYPMLAIDKFTQMLKAVTRPIKALSDFGDDYEDWDNFRKDYLR